MFPQIQRLAVRCIQKNVVVFQTVRHWPWWQLLSHVRPLLSVNVAEEQLRAKEVSAKGWVGQDRTGQGALGDLPGGLVNMEVTSAQGKMFFPPSRSCHLFLAWCHTFCRAVDGER